jgi:hypothetical protein
LKFQGPSEISENGSQSLVEPFMNIIYTPVNTARKAISSQKVRNYLKNGHSLPPELLDHCRKG